MRFSKWHGLGNDYLLVERADVGVPLEAGLVRRLCDYHVGIGSDGILEVLAVEGRRAEIVIWNPDGSTAELSGNGTRIAARWLARRSGADDVVIAVGPREVEGAHARWADGRDGDGRGRGGRPRDARRQRRRDRVHARLGRESARGHQAGARPRRPAAPRAARREPRALSRRGRTSSSSASMAQRGDGRRLGARSGGDAVLGHERGRGRRRRRRQRLVRRARSPCTLQAGTCGSTSTRRSTRA